MNARQTHFDAYLARIAAIHANLGRLQNLADDHLGLDLDAINWGHVVNIRRAFIGIFN